MNKNTTTIARQDTREALEALRELFSLSEWKETLREIHNDAEAVRQLSLFGYGISFALGGLITLILVVNFG